MIEKPLSIGASFYDEEGYAVSAVVDANGIHIFDSYELYADQIVEALNNYDQLQAENNQLKARVGELEQAINECKTRAFNADYVAQIRQVLYDLNDVLNETPKQILVDLQVESVETFVNSLNGLINERGYRDMSEGINMFKTNYIKQLKGEE